MTTPPGPTSGADAWREAIEEVVHLFRHINGAALALVVGQGDRARAQFSAQVRAALPELAYREVRLGPGELQPLLELERGADRGKYLIFVYGLQELDTDQRREALSSLNWNRSLIDRGGVKLVLWVEPELVSSLYAHAGDFADWWDAFVELPEGPRWQADGRSPRRKSKQALEHLLSELFATPESLVRFLHIHRDTRPIVADRRHLLESKSEVAFQTVEALESRGLTTVFLDRLAREFPLREADIHAVQALYSTSSERRQPKAAPQDRPSPAETSNAADPIRVVLLSLGVAVLLLFALGQRACDNLDGRSGDEPAQEVPTPP